MMERRRTALTELSIPDTATSIYHLNTISSSFAQYVFGTTDSDIRQKN